MTHSINLRYKGSHGQGSQGSWVDEGAVLLGGGETVPMARSREKGKRHLSGGCFEGVLGIPTWGLPSSCPAGCEL